MFQFRFLNIPVQIGPSFWLFLLFFTQIYVDPSLEKLLLGFICFFSLLIHEYGHAIAASFCGVKPTITLEAFGGVTQYQGHHLTTRQHFFITLCGPLLESLLIALPYALLKSSSLDNYYFRYTLYMTMQLNILWCLFNLIPVLPLDGGQMLRYLLEKRWGEKGWRACLKIGVISSLLLFPYLYYLGLFFFATLLFLLGLQSFQLLQKQKGSTAPKSPFHYYLKGIEAMQKQDLKKAKSLLNYVLNTKDSHIKHITIEALAKIYIQESQPQKAYQLLLKADPTLLKEGKCLLCRLAFEQGNYKLVSKYSRDIYAIEPSYEIAILNSKAFAHLKESALSGAWLQTASQFESACKKSLKDLLQQKMYDPVRNEQDFQTYTGALH